LRSSTDWRVSHSTGEKDSVLIPARLCSLDGRELRCAKSGIGRVYSILSSSTSKTFSVGKSLLRPA